MTTQFLQFALTSLYDSQKKSKTKKKKCPTVITKANRKIPTQIFKSTKLFTYYVLSINNSNDSRYKSSFLKRKKRERNKKKGETS